MIISMPMCGARNWRGEMVGFNGPVEIDDGDEKATAWAKAWLGMGATLVEDVKSAKAEPAKQPPAPLVPLKADEPKAEPVKTELPKKAVGGSVRR